MEKVLITVLVGAICVVTCTLFGLPILISLAAFAAFIFIGELVTIEYRNSRLAIPSGHAATFNWAFLGVTGVIFTALLLMLLVSYQ